MENKIRIRSKKWHYRIYRFYRHMWAESPLALWDMVRGKEHVPYYKPKGLCTYFWFLVLTTLFGWIVAILFLVFIALALVIIGFAVGFKYLIKQIKKLFPRRKPKFQPLGEPEHPRVHWVAEFAKAKKRRMCPLIEIVKEDVS